MSPYLSEIQTKIFRDEVIGHLFASKLCEGGREGGNWLGLATGGCVNWCTL